MPSVTEPYVHMKTPANANDGMNIIHSISDPNLVDENANYMKVISIDMDGENGDKTPESPLSPNSLNKRKVQFADCVFGRSLVSVKMITPNTSEENMSIDQLGRLDILHCEFEQPFSTEDFQERLHRQRLCLENVAFSGYALTGTILVENIEFSKDVTVRFSMDNWKTHSDVWADYVNQLAGGTLDRFQFRISVSQNIEAGTRLEFAVRFRAGAKEFWDSNNMKNYTVECRKSGLQINRPSADTERETDV